MKNIISSLLILFICVQIQAQTSIEKKIPINNIKNISIELPYANSIEIETWDQKYISIRAIVNIEEGKLDDHFKLKVVERFNSLEIASTYNKLFKKKKSFFDFFSNKNKATIITQSAKDEKIVIDGITIEATYSIYIPKDLELNLKSSTGNVSIVNFIGDLSTDIVSGDITVDEYQGNMKLKTVSGKIDIKINQTDALEIETIIGKIFKANRISRLVIGEKLIGSLATRKSDGNSIELTTVSGDIHLKQ